MKILRRCVIWFIIGAVFLLLGIEGFVYFRGRQFIERELSARMNRQVRIDEVHWNAPSGIVLRQVTIEGMGRAEQVKVNFVLSSLWQRPWKVSEMIIINPEFIVPGSGRKMLFSGRTIKGYGWLDWKKKDMDARIMMMDFSHKQILTAHLKGTNNDLVVSGRLHIPALMAQEKQRLKLASYAYDTFDKILNTLNQDKMTDFSFQTKMDSFHLENISFSGKILIP